MIYFVEVFDSTASLFRRMLYLKQICVIRRYELILNKYGVDPI